jgi:cytidylate kinase
MGLVVSFAGQIGSGKSSVSRSLAATLGWPRAAFGDYLRKRASELGLDTDSRQVLQDLGQSLVEKDAAAFCRAVLLNGGYTPGCHMLVDGVRHAEIQRDIAAIVAPSVSKLIYLRVGKSERLSRVQERVNGQRDFGRAEGHEVEAELRRELPDIADTIIDAELELPLVLNECGARIQGWMSELV